MFTKIGKQRRRNNYVSRFRSNSSRCGVRARVSAACRRSVAEVVLCGAARGATLQKRANRAAQRLADGGGDDDGGGGGGGAACLAAPATIRPSISQLVYLWRGQCVSQSTSARYRE